VFSVLSSAIEARSAGGTRVRGVGWLKRRGGGGVSDCGGRVIDLILPQVVWWLLRILLSLGPRPRLVSTV